MRENLKTILNDCFKKKKALLAVNVQNIYHLQAIKEVTESLKVPVIVQFSARYVVHFEKRLGLKVLSNIYKNDFMYFHLDHCQDLDLIQFCIDNKFDGVMYDGSAEEIEKNIENTKYVASIAARTNCIVEGELGEIGGVEDGVGNESMSYVNLNEVKRYVDETAVDLLALGIGNAHGFYTSLKAIDSSILREANEILGNTQQLVLHGGTGLPEGFIRDTITYGVVKINFSTQLKQITNDGLQTYLDREELYNEINFESDMIRKIEPFLIENLLKYTI